MKYVFYADGKSKELTYEEALRLVLNVYKDCDITRDMLTITNNIKLREGWIEVTDGSGMVLMAGLWNYTPTGVMYDDEGNRY